ncbi:hypothetical protein KJ567_02895, partial [Candidatus Bipolaricaulota bacterium]|nr:hypothetical protein [Candidatus Bipolaricaulota bacterium]
FSIDAAETVAGSSPASLAGLANRCMIRRTEADRYEIHELLRQFSLQRLEQNPAEHAAVRTAHAEYFAGRIETLFERLKGREQVAALRLIRRDIANIRIAWCRAAEEGRLDLLERTAAAMFFYYDVSAFFEEGQQAFEDALSILKDAPKPSAVLGFVKTCYGWFVQHACFGESRDWIRDGLDVVDAAAPFGSLHAYAHVIAAYAGVFADPGEGARRLEQSLAFYRQANDRWGESLALTAVAEYAVRDDPKRGEEYALESLRLSQQFEDLWGQALTLNALARFAERRGDLGLAKVRYHQSQRLAELIAPDLFTVVDTLISRARVGCLLGDRDEADELAEEAIRLARQAGNSLLIARALRRRGRQACDRGEFAAAKRDLLESLSLLQARSRTEEAALCAVALGDTEKASGDRTSATGWYQEAASLDANCAEAAERLRSVAEGSG